MTLEKTIIGILEQYYNTNEIFPIKPETTTVELGMDDLDVIEFVMQLEDGFSIDIGDEKVEDFMDTSVKEIVECLTKMKADLKDIQWQKVGF